MGGPVLGKRVEVFEIGFVLMLLCGEDLKGTDQHVIVLRQRQASDVLL